MLIGIFGTGRNGSTLLMRLLDGSNSLWGHPLELNYFRDYCWQGFSIFRKIKYFFKQCLIPKKWKKKFWQSFFIKHCNEIIETYIKLSEKNKENISFEKLNNIFTELNNYDSGLSIKKDFVKLMELIKFLYDNRQLSKEPNYFFKSTDVFLLNYYEKIFPDMKFIHLLREPLSTYSSTKRTVLVSKKKPFWFHGGDILKEFIENRFIPHIKFINKKLKLKSKNHLIIKYEDLCDNPEVQIKKICKWLKIDMPKEPTRQTVLGGLHLLDVPVNSSQSNVKTPEFVVSDMKGKYNYESVIDDREKDFIILRTYKFAKKFDYFNNLNIKNIKKIKLGFKWLIPDKWEKVNVKNKLFWLYKVIKRRFYIIKKLIFT